MKKDKGKNILVSVVIPNNGRDISATRRALSGLDNVEILEIDLGKERSVQRNIGIRAAKGKYIFILDSDQVPTASSVAECVRKMELYPNCVGIFIPEIIVGDDWFTKLRNFERRFYTGTYVDVVRFVRNPCPLFDENLTGPEDADWDLRINGMKLISYFPLYHYDNINLKQYIAKKAYYAKSMRRFKEKHPNAKVLDLKYRCFTIFVEKGNWKILLLNPIKTLMLIALIFARGVIYLRSFLSKR